MKLPAIQGVIDRRILINYTVDPEVAKKIIPTPFRPQFYDRKAIVGICLIRLKGIRPKGFPEWMGISSENAAHRFAVEWDENGINKTGVYIPRRDTSSTLNSLAGGRIFPGIHYKAKFEVEESNGTYSIGFQASDATYMNIIATEASALPQNSVFKTIGNASDFFQNGCDGYSPGTNGFDGVKLQTYNWEVIPLNVQKAESSFFSDKHLFPEGSLQLDNALLMKNIEHEWHQLGRKK